MAADFPSHPIRLVVPYAAGGVTDIAARIVAQQLTTLLGHPVVIENRGGGGTRIGADTVAKSPPDGYTLLYANSITHGSLSATAGRLPFDPMRDFAPIGPVGWYPSILVCNPRVPARSIQDLILLLRRNPGGIRYASAGPGTGNHFAGELFNLRAGVHIEHVPYRGSGPALQDTLAGVVDCTFDGAPHRYVASGELIALGTTGGERDPRLPEIPTFQESGVPDFQLVFWQGLAAPAAIPADRLVVLEDALRRALDDRGTRSRLYETGLTVQSGTAADLERMMRTDIARYREITELGGLHFE